MAPNEKPAELSEAGVAVWLGELSRDRIRSGDLQSLVHGYTIMPKTLATATVDRLLHHAHLVLTKGDSHRLAEALAGKGVIPLTT
jgi:IstB-like ATP binding protein